MQKFYYNIAGKGKKNIILLSGWGLHSKIWLFIIKELQFFFKFYLIDLPGFGKNKKLFPMKIDQIVEILHDHMPKKSIWMGWSMGGLIASKLALSYPKDILAVVTVASSPCFIEKPNWPGIKKNTVQYFYENLKKNYYRTIDNFLNLQITNKKQYIKDINILKKILFSEEKPSLNFLQNNLEIILYVDLRLEMNLLEVPLLRIYGALDSLVPKKIVKILDKKWPNTNSSIIKKAAHMPFISHKKEFCLKILQSLNIF
ncbi:hypothetical protein ATN01_02705 [Buchnera aphidicola (Diuraphis noxia)]|uniref:Pimeloyl-[acyl-carrier protein] methyl ester esterase n=1 Tax=Buchnera aphidicola subsp. Diuraphis noxia TaxID=118101 RepID=A0A1B2H9D3_BUCDN|nr:pimeloyl-ACP methyl ester esterase BioH [Buchnera aphidicola]ANZ22726.1 hypothetical protein ATN01_02705 [Buchnera aphidicola (Diuraphis noxia)]